MKSPALFLVLSLASAGLAAQNMSPAIDAGELLAGHLRYVAKRGAAFGYRYTDGEGIVRFVELSSQGNDNSDSFSYHRTKLSFGHLDSEGTARNDSVVAIALTSVSSGKDAELSLRLVPDGDEATVSVGGDELEYECIIPYSDISTLQPFCNEKAREVYSHHVTEQRAGQMGPYLYDAETLQEQLLQSSNSFEGLWRHYEQESSSLVASSDRRYTLGCIATDSGYDLFIIAATGKNPLQAPGTVKGRLTPTGMPGVYDVAWTDANGRTFAAGTSAIFSDNLLTLVFPRWETSVRYVKLKQAP